MTCGLCGSGITADEKFKKLKDGSVNRHVYYGCTRVRDKSCKCGYLNEVDLIKQLNKILEEIDINDLSILPQLQKEITRYKKFKKMILKEESRLMVSDIDTRNYLKFILENGEIEEKRQIISSIKSNLFLKNKVIYLSTSEFNLNRV